LTTVRKLVTQWGFEVDDKQLNKFEERLTSVKETAFKLGEIVVAQVGSLYLLAESTARETIEVNKMAQAVGIGTSQLRAMQYAAKLTGTEAETLTNGLRLLSRQALAAAQGNQQAAQKFNYIGVSIFDVNGKLKTSDKLMMSISERFQRMPDGIAKTGMAMQLFGRAGAQLIPFLNKGPAALKAYADEWKNFEVGPELVERSHEFEQSQVRVFAALKNLRDLVALQIMPIITQYSGELFKWYLANKDIIVQNMTDFFKGMVPVAKAAFEVLAAGAKVAMTLAHAMGGLGNVMKIVVAGLVGLGAAQTVVGILGLIDPLKKLWAMLMQVAMAESLSTGGMNLLIGAGVAAAVGGGAYYAMTRNDQSQSPLQTWQSSHGSPSGAPAQAAPMLPGSITIAPQVHVDARGAAPGVEHKVREVTNDALNIWVAGHAAQVVSPLSH
jgi:hypothetical protein